MEYPVLAHCRVCLHASDEVRKEIDKRLLSGDSLKVIQEDFKLQFPPSKPLTIESLKLHRNHLYETVALGKLSDLGIAPGSLTFKSHTQEELDKEKFQLDTFKDINSGVIQEENILKSLIIDSYNDINSINEAIEARAFSDKYFRSMLATKDVIKKTLIDTLQKNRELNQKDDSKEELKRNLKLLSQRLFSVVSETMDMIDIPQEKKAEFGRLLKEAVLKDADLAQIL